MRSAHTVEQVRAAEAALMATLPEGALMQRAAAGLASAVLDLLGRAYGSTVVLLVGAGDNGGDALYAGALLARRGVRVLAWSLSDTPHAAGLAALHRAGGRSITEAPRRAPDLVVDGIVGIGGRPGLRPEAEQALRALAGVPVVAVDVPSGVDVDIGRAGRTGRAGRRHGHLRHAQGRAAGRPGRRARRRGPPRRHRAGPPGGRASRASRPPTSRPCCRGPTRRPRSTRAAWSASAPAR